MVVNGCDGNTTDWETHKKKSTTAQEKQENTSKDKQASVYGPRGTTEVIPATVSCNLWFFPIKGAPENLNRMFFPQISSNIPALMFQADQSGGISSLTGKNYFCPEWAKNQDSWTCWPQSGLSIIDQVVLWNELRTRHALVVPFVPEVTLLEWISVWRACFSCITVYSSHRKWKRFFRRYIWSMCVSANRLSPKPVHFFLLAQFLAHDFCATRRCINSKNWFPCLCKLHFLLPVKFG